MAFPPERRIGAVDLLQEIHLDGMRIDGSRELVPQQNPLRQTHGRQQPFVLDLRQHKENVY